MSFPSNHDFSHHVKKIPFSLFRTLIRMQKRTRIIFFSEDAIFNITTVIVTTILPKSNWIYSRIKDMCVSQSVVSHLTGKSIAENTASAKDIR